MYVFMSDSPSANFSLNRLERAAMGASLALPLAVAGSTVYGRKQVEDNMTNSERRRLKSTADRFNSSYDKYLATKPGILQNPADSPEGRRFTNTGQQFMDTDEELRKKYVNPWKTSGLALGTLGLGAGLGIASKYLI